MCFCSDYRKDNGIFSTLFTEFEVKDNLGNEISGYACGDWYKGKLGVTILKLSVSLVIVAFNSLLRFAIKTMAEWMGKRTVGR